MKPDAKSKKIPAVIYFYLIYQPMRKDVNKKLLFCALCQISCYLLDFPHVNNRNPCVPYLLFGIFIKTNR